MVYTPTDVRRPPDIPGFPSTSRPILVKAQCAAAHARMSHSRGTGGAIAHARAAWRSGMGMPMASWPASRQTPRWASPSIWPARIDAQHIFEMIDRAPNQAATLEKSRRG